MAKWLAGKNTKTTTGPVFKTKRDAIAWARCTFSGIFFVWRIK